MNLNTHLSALQHVAITSSLPKTSLASIPIPQPMVLPVLKLLIVYMDVEGDKL